MIGLTEVVKETVEQYGKTMDDVEDVVQATITKWYILLKDGTYMTLESSKPAEIK